MILLDTNVVSEVIGPRPDARVRRWLDSYAEIDFYICTPVIAELRFGLEIMPQGKKRDALVIACDAIEYEIFAGRILVFEQHAAHGYAKLRAARQASGRPLPVMDGMIAAIAAAHSMTIATRNIADFEGLDIHLIDPFRDAAN